MRDEGATLLALAGYFSLMSLFAIGGANSAVPEMYRVAVEIEKWLTDRQFADIFALAQLTPGPNVIIVSLIGYKVAGVIGGVVATLAMCGPTCIFAFYVGGVWERFKQARWRAVIQAGLLPISIGLIFASAYVVVVGYCSKLGRGRRHLGHGARNLHYEIESAVDFCRGRAVRVSGRVVNVLNLFRPDLLSVAVRNVLRKKIVC